MKKVTLFPFDLPAIHRKETQRRSEGAVSSSAYQTRSCVSRPLGGYSRQLEIQFFAAMQQVILSGA
jgi:hypothetical protein